MMQPHSFSKTGPARVLLLTDQPVLARLIMLTLSHGPFLVREAAGLAEAEAEARDWNPHIAIVDMDAAGGQFLERIGRAAGAGGLRTPVLALTRRGELKTKLDAFERGVDDIMTVPFSPEELLARVLVIARRSYGEALPFAPVLRVGDLEVDIVNHSVRVGGQNVHLSGLEQALLYLLAANAGRVIRRDEILDALWGGDYVAESNLVDRHIRNLRRRLHDDWRTPRFIATVPGQGYSFVLPNAQPAEPAADTRKDRPLLAGP